jgi:DNA-directed RNA polymerase specialized sigma24 family protein
VRIRSSFSSSSPSILPSDPDLERLIRRTVSGDVRAWHTLWCAVDPFMYTVAGRWRLTGVLAQDKDERRNVVVRALGLLPLTEEIEEHLPASLRGFTAAEAHLIAARAAARLREDQRHAVALWVQSYEWEEIARALGLPDAKSAERLVRSGIALLRKLPAHER